MPFLSPRRLFVLAALSVVGLLLVSDLAPLPVERFSHLGSTGESEVVCIVAKLRPNEKGFLMNLTDSEGEHRDAFCAREDMVPGVTNGSVVSMVVQPSEEDPRFLFVRSLRLLYT
jgi:hypothetical protein